MATEEELVGILERGPACLLTKPQTIRGISHQDAERNLEVVRQDVEKVLRTPRYQRSGMASLLLINHFRLSTPSKNIETGRLCDPSHKDVASAKVAVSIMSMNRIRCHCL